LIASRFDLLHPYRNKLERRWQNCWLHYFLKRRYLNKILWRHLPKV